MGLGKSLCAIALIHTVLTSQAMPHTRKGVPIINTVLVIVPSNVLVNWSNEFDKWTGKLSHPLVVDSINNHNSLLAQENAIDRWHTRGGVFILTEGKLQSLLKRQKQPQPDILVVDEAHTMLKTMTNKNFQALNTIKTPRKILLSGSPFCGNLLEYFRMVSYIRPGVFPAVKSESDFVKLYVEPIQEGEAADATEQEVYAYLSKTKEINKILAPYVHRKDASVLREVLPPLQQVVLHVRQSRQQCRLYRGYERLRERGNEHDGEVNYKNFLRTYHDTRLLHNHPGCLLIAHDKHSSAEEDAYLPKEQWWQQFLKPGDEERLGEVGAGYKIALLLHILVASTQQKDKVLIFSESLVTLNFVESVLALDNWHDHVPALPSSPGDAAFGGWRKDHDYFRMDGFTSAEDRGILVDRFNNDQSGNIKVFLISMAGGIGM